MCSDALPLTSKGDQKAEILCSKGKSNGKSEVSWYPRVTRVGLYSTKIYRRPSRPSGFPICWICALRVHPGFGWHGALLCPLPRAGPGGGQGAPRRPAALGVSERALWPWPKQSCEVRLFHFLPSGPFPLTCPVTENCLVSRVGRGGESIKLPHTRM